MVKNQDSGTRPPPKLWADDLPPENVEAEMVILNSLVVADARIYDSVRPLLRSEMFIQADHQIIFDTLTEIRDAGGPMDAFILRNALAAHGELEDVGGVDYLAAIMQAAPNPAHAAAYVGLVVETHKLRQLDRMAMKARQTIRQPSYARDPANHIIENLQNDLASLVDSSASNEIQTMGEIMRTVMVSMKGGGAPRLSTGINALDLQIGGLGIGEMTLIAARPSMGKSLLGKQIADQLAQRGTSVFFGNVEENNQKTGRNWLSLNAKIANHRVRSGALTKDEWATAEQWENFSKDLPFYLCDRAMTLTGMCNVIALAHARHKIKVAFVDYLQLVDAEAGDTREQEVSKVSRTLKNLFKRLAIAGVVIAQLNRSNEHGQLRPPRLSDLRDSGQIEQDADVVILIHRPDFYCRDNGTQPTGKVQLIIAKNRDGSREGDIELKANLEHQEFVEVQAVDPFI